jgi:hypothetical protein
MRRTHAGEARIYTRFGGSNGGTGGAEEDGQGSADACQDLWFRKRHVDLFLLCWKQDA